MGKTDTNSMISVTNFFPINNILRKFDLRVCSIRYIFRFSATEYLRLKNKKPMEKGESEMYYWRAVRIDEGNDIFTLKRNGNHFKSSQAYKIGQSQYAQHANGSTR